jgi:hypothetical protein
MNTSNQKMSWSDERNKPDGTRTQKYYCVHPWEGEHVTEHNNLEELSRAFGVSITLDMNEYCIPKSSVQVVYVISGSNPLKVDGCKTAMSHWLRECSMYN